MKHVTITLLGGFGFGVFWYTWGIHGVWWAILYGVFWEVWLGYRIATVLLGG